MSRVSVVVASYNHARFLRTCIESVLSQTYDDLELLVIDDRSSDDSLDIARSFDDPRVLIHLNETNLGTYATENAGLDMATGDWIAILNSDDYWRPEKLTKQMALLSDSEAVFSYTLGDVVDDAGAAIPGFDQHADWPREPIQDVLPYLLDVNQILASSVVFRKGAVRFEPKLRYCGDWVAAIRLAQQGKAAFVNEPLGAWRQHPGNASKQLSKTIGEEIRIRLEVLSHSDLWLNSSQADVARQRLARCALALGAHLLLVGNRDEAIEALRKGLEFDPGNETLRKRLFAAKWMPLSMVQRRLWPNVDIAQIQRDWRPCEGLSVG